MIKPPLPDMLSNTHVGHLLTMEWDGEPVIGLSTPDDILDADAATFDSWFGPMLEKATDEKAFANALFDAKQRVASIYAHTLFNTKIDDQKTAEKLGRYWSAFADWTIDKALRFVWSLQTIQRFLLPAAKGKAEIQHGLFILGLGKLGGCDLNYSSDIDLVAFFDPDAMMVRPDAGRTDVANRVLKGVTQILSGSLGPRIWRVDWRLRPDPSVTGLAMSDHAGLDFYFFHAAPWRRLAMMKARPVAGDIALGRSFLSELTPFVWRKTLDFRAVEELGGIKRRIRDEHPDVAEELSDDTPLDRQEGFHTKLGSGGIREIEFIVNAMQLVWAGRQPELRDTHTMSALRLLGRCGHLNDGHVRELSRAYVFLRGLENRIQLLADAHTHAVPHVEKAATGDLQRLLALCGDMARNRLFAQLGKIRASVNALFEDTFSASAGTVDTPEKEWLSRDFVKSLSADQKAIVQGWEDGFSAYGVASESAASLRPLFAVLVERLEAAADPSLALQTIDAYLRQLPPGGQYLNLLAQSADLVRDILGPLQTGGAMARLLNHQPHVVDLLIQRRGDTATTPAQRAELLDFVYGQPSYETRLEAMRSHVNEMLYLAYLRVWRGQISLAEGRKLLSDIAVEALHNTYNLVCDEYGTDPANLSVLGFGKLGMGAMMPESDLDIVFLAHGSDSLELDDVQGAHRLANRFKTALSAEMRGGRVYEIDTRLRPSGASGAPTVRLATFRSHQLERAKTWEHLALVPARFVHGPDFARQAFEATAREVLTRPRDQQQLVKDGHSMLGQLRDHRIRPFDRENFSLKLASGGLMEAEYLVSFLVLKYAADNPDLIDAAYHELPERLERLSSQLSGFADDFSFLQDAHNCERLMGWTGLSIDQIDFSGSPLKMSTARFDQRLYEAVARTSDHMTAFITEPSGLSAKKLATYREEAVRWA